MATTTAALIITSWEVIPINPDGTVNSWLPTVSGNAPTDLSTDLIDWFAMGSRFRLILNCELSGTYADGSSPSLQSGTIRYNPALFMDYMGMYSPPGTIPSAGYSLQIPGSYNPSVPSSYTMVLIGQKENINTNQNGTVTLDLVGLDEFVITHDLYLTADVEQYPQGRSIPNYFRLSKNSIYNDFEDNIDRPSVYSEIKGLNVSIGLSNRLNFVYAEYLSIPFNAAFAGREKDGSDSAMAAEWIIERVSDPGTEHDSLSPFERNLVKIRITDPSALIVENESEIMVVNRSLAVNVAGFVEDFELSQTKAITTGGTTQRDGFIYNPVTWSQSGGITEISFVVDGLEKSSRYQIHFKAAIQDNPSTQRFMHYMTEVIQANGAPVQIGFSMESEFWSRNGNHAEHFTIVPGERATSVLSLNATEYDSMSFAPWTSFIDDINSVKVQIFDEDSEEVFFAEVLKNENGSWPDNDHIGLYIESGPSIDTIYHFYLNEFRVPYLNYQNLPDWTGKDFTFRWTALFIDPEREEYSGEYYQDTVLTVSELDNENPSPYIENVNYLDPETLEPITDWHNLSTILVTATVDPVGPNTYIAVMVDKYPLGAILFNDFALEEEDPTAHSTPDWVIFEQKVSDLVSDVPAQPEDGGISFLLDVSDLADEEEYYVYIVAYEA